MDHSLRGLILITWLQLTLATFTSASFGQPAPPDSKVGAPHGSISRDGITIHADFERGSLGEMKFVAPNRVAGPTRHWRKADGIGDQYYWFYFQVDNAKDRELTFDLEGLMGVYRGRPHELYTDETRPVVTYNGKNWERISAGQLRQENSSILICSPIS